MAFDAKEESEYLTFRVAIASGLFASLGASLAWLVWLAHKVPFVELATSVAVGVIVGFLVHWCEQYRHVAGHERKRLPPEEKSRTGAAIFWAALFGLLGLASEHFVSDLAMHFLKPLLGSLATLLPAGIIFGAFLHVGYSETRKLSDIVVGGLVSGAFVALTTGFIWWLGWGKAPWFPLFCWWCLVGLGIRLFAPTKRNTMLFYQPVCGVVTAFVLMVVLSLIPISRAFVTRTGPVGDAAVLIRGMAQEVIATPGIPAEFWLQADGGQGEPPGGIAPAAPAAQKATPVVQAQPVMPPKTTDKATTNWSQGFLNERSFHNPEKPRARLFDPNTMSRGFAKALGGAPPPPISTQGGMAGLKPDTSAQSSSVIGQAQQMTSLSGKSPGAPGAPSTDDEVTRQAQEISSLSNNKLLSKMENPDQALRNYFNSKPTAQGGNEAWKLILAEFRKGFASPFVRSWVVLLLFGIGLGLAPTIERSLRPPDYPSSATFKKDLTIAVFLVVAILAACLYARIAT